MDVRPGMLKVTMMFCFRDEPLMLKFAKTVKDEHSPLFIEFHYEPTHAIVVQGVISPGDVCRLLSSATDFPGVTHASAELETILEDIENTGVEA